MNIGIDFDGVIIDFEERIRYKANIYDYLERNNKEIKSKDSYAVEEKYGWSNDEWYKFARKYLIQLTKESELIPGAKEVIRLLQDDGHKLYIISARGIEFNEMITIVNQKLEEENLTFSKCYWKVKNKLDIINKEKIDIMIDDNPDTCEKVSNNNINTLYFKNLCGRKLLENSKLKEVNNWGEVYRYINELNKRKTSNKM